MKNITFAAALLAVLGFVNPSAAADIPVKGPIYKAAPAPTFNWTGFYVGAHIGYGWAQDDGNNEVDGMLGGAQVGYNWHLSRNFVFGVEADIAATDMSNAFANIDYIGTVRARLGYAVDRVLFYGTGGYAYTSVNNGGLDIRGDGYVIGAGLEYALARNWSAKIEYLHYDLDTDGFGGMEASTVKLGLNYRFGW